MKNDNMDKILKILDRYKVNGENRKEFLGIIDKLYLHPEFARRFGSEFLHHGNVSVGEHIIEDAVKTYLLSKKYMLKHDDYDLEVAVYIAIFHDLYTVPWQNNDMAKVNKFRNLHGFRHPIEAVINSYTWYPEIYEKYDAYKIIDGIIHHMFPLPVTVVTGDGNYMELKNIDLYNNLPTNIKDYLMESPKRLHIGAFSIARSKYKEGIIMSRADKYVSIRQFKGISDWLALVTGKNKRLK